MPSAVEKCEPGFYILRQSENKQIEPFHKQHLNKVLSVESKVRELCITQGFILGVKGLTSLKSG